MYASDTDTLNLSGKRVMLEARMRLPCVEQVATLRGWLVGALYGSHTYTPTRLLFLHIMLML